jgi:hypothetical protein
MCLKVVFLSMTEIISLIIFEYKSTSSTHRISIIVTVANNYHQIQRYAMDCNYEIVASAAEPVLLGNDFLS